MTEAEWLKSRGGFAMLELVNHLLSVRKFAILDGEDPPPSSNWDVPDDVFHRIRRDGISAKPTKLANLLREQLGNPFRPYRCEPEWRTETVLALASGIEAERAFDRMPILADALEEAGCDEQPMLDHLRGPGPHARGCWVLDLILNREPELFALPPLVPTPRRMKLGPFTPPPEGMA